MNIMSMSFLFVRCFNTWVVMFGSVAVGNALWLNGFCTCMRIEILSQIHTRSNVHMESKFVIVRSFFCDVSNFLCFTVLVRFSVL